MGTAIIGVIAMGFSPILIILVVGLLVVVIGGIVVIANMRGNKD